MAFGARDRSKNTKARQSGSAVHSVSIPRTAATAQSPRRRPQAHGQARMRRFESAIARLEIGERLPSAAGITRVALGSGWHPSKIVSALLVVAAVAALALIHVDDDWFVYAEDVQFRNLTYLDSAELYRQSEVEGWNTLWLTTSHIRNQLLDHPYVADATVNIRLPAQVTVDVVETYPVALWVTKDETLWLTAGGPACCRADRPGAAPDHRHPG